MAHDMARRPIIYLAVVLPMMLLGVGVVIALIETFSELRGVPRSAIPNLNGALISLPAFVLWLPISLLLSNCVLYAVPSLRRVAERFVLEARRPSFRESQRQLLQIAAVIALVCVPLIVLGF